jgi:hypothetical protein
VIGALPTSMAVSRFSWASPIDMRHVGGTSCGRLAAVKTLMRATGADLVPPPFAPWGIETQSREVPLANNDDCARVNPSGVGRA